MSFKLSLRNARRQANDYLIYFVTIILTTALIFAFNALSDSQEIRSLSTMLDPLPIMIVLASIVVVGIMGWLVHYIIRFMLQKRSREFGTYLLMGLTKNKIVSIFLVENIMIGAIALVLGLLLGNVVFQGLRAIVMNLFGLKYTLSFHFSLKAVLLTLLYITLMYAFALWRSRRRIKKTAIYGLLYSDKENETMSSGKTKRRKKTFVLSVVFIIVGVVFLCLRILLISTIGAVIAIIGLYGFFIHFSAGVPAYFDKRPTRKYTGTNMMVFRTLSSKLLTMGITMATISVLFSATLAAEGTGLQFAHLFNRGIALTAPFDFFVSNRSSQADFTDYKEYLHDHTTVKQEYEYQIYYADNNRLQEYLIKHKPKYWHDPDVNKDSLIKFSDYSKLRMMLGYEKVELSLQIKSQ